MSTKRYGVQLALPGAPDAAHDVPGLLIPLRPGQVEPVEGADLERARALAKNGAPIEVVSLTTKTGPAGGKE